MLLAPLALAFSAAAPQIDGDDVARRYDLRRTPAVEVVEAASPAVVYIQTDGVQEAMDFFGRLIRQRVTGAGSGVVILKEGFIVTNYHVVRGARAIKVSFDQQYDMGTYDATLISYVEAEDLALLKIAPVREFPTIPMGTSSDLMPGETVIAIGNPYGQTHTVSVGIVSGLHRNVEIQTPHLAFDDLIQTDASINPGNSGGPLLNIHGELIGINCAVNVQAENIGFAIPVDRVREVLEGELLDPGTAPSWLGFDLEPGDRLLVRRVVPGSPADESGLRPGDRVLALQGQPLAREEQYRLARVCLPADQQVELAVEREGRRLELSMRPWDKADGILYEKVGLTVEPVWIGRTRYVQVARVCEGGPADQLGLMRGDLLESVRFSSGGRPQTRPINGRTWLAGLVAALEPGAPLEVDVYRDVDGDGRITREELHRGTLVRR
jgi:S1-C subfamily serine protease